jgi:23S rRNA (adenine2503-C2)-methyltransferase
MNIIASTGDEQIAVVYIVELHEGKLVECVESLQPPLPREEKWVLLVSTMYGCPVGCQMCDAGGHYAGKVSKEDILDQVDYLVRKHYPDGQVPARQFKIQFARMGEPSLNLSVLDVIEEIPHRYDVPGFMPSISTVAPLGTDRFFERLLDIKQDQFSGGRFQFQFSIHTTDQALRDRLIPVKKWDFARMAAYGERFFEPGDRKISLNFALAKDMPVEASRLLDHFDPARFLIKITPLNPTYQAVENGLSSYIDAQQDFEADELIQTLQAAGYQTIVSIGDLEENYIGSNCGQYLRTHLKAGDPIETGYTYPVEEYSS